MLFEPKPDRFETTCGLIVSILASFLAFVQIMDDNFGAEELKAVNEKAQAYQWQQSKGIKQNLIEGQVNLIETLISSNSISAKDTFALNQNLKKLNLKIEKYEKEKKEILLGSKAIGKENWIQEKDGQMGLIIGAQEWEAIINKYNSIGDHMAFSSMFLQISMVMGGLALIMQKLKLKLYFFYSMMFLGCLGIFYSLFHLLSSI